MCRLCHGFISSLRVVIPPIKTKQKKHVWLYLSSVVLCWMPCLNTSGLSGLFVSLDHRWKDTESLTFHIGAQWWPDTIKLSLFFKMNPNLHPVLFPVRSHCADVQACRQAWTCTVLSQWPQKPRPPPVLPSPGTCKVSWTTCPWLPPLHPPLSLVKPPQSPLQAQVEPGVWAEPWGGSEIVHTSRRMIQCPFLHLSKDI